RRTPLVAQPMPEGRLEGMNPFGNRLKTLSATEHGRDHGGQHGHKVMTTSLSSTRIGDLLQTLQQSHGGTSTQSHTSLPGFNNRLRPNTPRSHRRLQGTSRTIPRVIF